MSLAQVTDHSQRALSRLLEQYKGMANIAGRFNAAAAQQQAIENALWGVLTQRTLAVAVGTQLDELGVVLGLPRDGRTDPTYRLWLQAKIQLDIGSGTTPDVLAVFTPILVGIDATLTAHVIEEPVAAFVLRIGGNSIDQAVTAPQLARFLGMARAAGVRAILEFLNAAPAATFTYDGTGAQGYDNGAYAGAIEGV